MLEEGRYREAVEIGLGHGGFLGTGPAGTTIGAGPPLVASGQHAVKLVGRGTQRGRGPPAAVENVADDGELVTFDGLEDHCRRQACESAGTAR